MDSKTLGRLISAGESQTVEFKSTFSNEAIETVGAFSNAVGGKLLLGISDRGELLGTELAPETVRQWLNDVKTKTHPSVMPEAEILNLRGRTIVVLHVKEYPVKPVSVKGRYYRRAGNSNHLMRADEVAQAHYRAFNSSWDYTPDPEHSLKDISMVKIKKFIRLVNLGRKTKITDSPVQALKKFNLLRRGQITRACYLLFLKAESLFTAVELGRFQSRSVIKDGARAKGDLFAQVEAVLDFITKHINKEYVITGNARRIERWDYPLEALREIVVNSIVHRDYTGATSGVVKVFDDKIEITNSGRLPHGLTVPMLLSGEYASEPRNLQVAEIFKEAGIIERYGSGIGRIVDEFKAYGLPSPEFKEAGNNFCVTVHKNPAPTSPARPGRVGWVDGLAEKWVDGLAENQKKILRLTQNKPRISKMELGTLLGISPNAVDKNILSLKAKGLLRRVGPDRGGHWEVINTQPDPEIKK